MHMTVGRHGFELWYGTATKRTTIRGESLDLSSFHCETCVETVEVGEGEKWGSKGICSSFANGMKTRGVGVDDDDGNGTMILLVSFKQIPMKFNSI